MERNKTIGLFVQNAYEINYFLNPFHQSLEL